MSLTPARARHTHHLLRFGVLMTLAIDNAICLPIVAADYYYILPTPLTLPLWATLVVYQPFWNPQSIPIECSFCFRLWSLPTNIAPYTSDQSLVKHPFLAIGAEDIVKAFHL